MLDKEGRVPSVKQALFADASEQLPVQCLEQAQLPLMLKVLLVLLKVEKPDLTSLSVAGMFIASFVLCTGFPDGTGSSNSTCIGFGWFLYDDTN
jgi:hypothetical protein